MWLGKDSRAKFLGQSGVSHKVFKGLVLHCSWSISSQEPMTFAIWKRGMQLSLHLPVCCTGIQELHSGHEETSLVYFPKSCTYFKLHSLASFMPVKHLSCLSEKCHSSTSPSQIRYSTTHIVLFQILYCGTN